MAAKKSTQLKKKNVPHFCLRHWCSVGNIKIPCFRVMFGSRKRRVFQIFVFWAVLELDFEAEISNPAYEMKHIIIWKFFLLTYLSKCLGQSEYAPEIWASYTSTAPQQTIAKITNWLTDFWGKPLKTYFSVFKQLSLKTYLKKKHVQLLFVTKKKTNIFR